MNEPITIPFYWAVAMTQSGIIIGAAIMLFWGETEDYDYLPLFQYHPPYEKSLAEKWDIAFAVVKNRYPLIDEKELLKCFIKGARAGIFPDSMRGLLTAAQFIARL